MQFNEFSRRLEKCHLDEDTKYLMSHLFEVMVELNKQLDAAMSVIMELTRTVGSVVELHAATQDKVKQLMRGGRPDGVEVHSVRNDPDE